MVKRKRVSALKPPTASNPSAPLVLFSDVIVGSVDAHVELESCVPSTNICSLTTSGVRRLIRSFLGNESETKSVEDHTHLTTGYYLGADLAMVVPFAPSMMGIVEEHFKKQGLSAAQVEERIKSRPQWYGIVDGLHSHTALTYIKNNYNGWDSFKWYVKILNSGFPIDKYRQLARIQNSKHDAAFFIELTLFDILYNLRLEHERLKREKKKCGGSETAQAYDGTRHARNSTLQQKANLSIRIPLAVLEEMGKIMNQDHPEMIMSSKSMNKKGAQTEDELMERTDCRLFRKFINIVTLKGSSSFLNASGEKSEIIQINTLHRLKDHYMQASFKTIQPETLTFQFKLATMAQKEHDKFLKFIEDEKWPHEMRDMKDNLLRSTILDKDLEENSNNDTTILPKLLDCYRRHFPDTSARKEAKWNASIELPIDDVQNNEPPSIESDDSNDSKKADEGDEKTNSTLNTSDDREIDEFAILKEKGIHTFNMCWKQYQTEKRNSQSDRFDLMITRPPSPMSRCFIRSMRTNSTSEELEKTDMQEITKFMKRCMKSAGYIILIINFTMFREWYEVLDEDGFIVMPDLFIITFDIQTIKKRKLSNFGQSAHETALIAKLPGSHPSGFVPEFATHIDAVTGQSIRYCLLSNVPATKCFLTKPNSKVPFDVQELHPIVYQNLVELFTPNGGSVIDPFARTMTSGIGCMQCSRSCHLIEKRAECHDAAVIRLRDAALPLPTNDAISKATYTPPQTYRVDSEAQRRERSGFISPLAEPESSCSQARDAPDKSISSTTSNANENDDADELESTLKLDDSLHHKENHPEEQALGISSYSINEEDERSNSTRTNSTLADTHKHGPLSKIYSTDTESETTVVTDITAALPSHQSKSNMRRGSSRLLLRRSH